MALPIAGFIVSTLGRILKKKLTKVGAGTVVAGVATLVATGQDPFESAKMLIDLVQQAWPHILVLVGVLGSIAGLFRKAGASKEYQAK